MLNDSPYQPFVPYEQFDLNHILKVTAAICNLDLADLNCDTNLPQASMFWVYCLCSVYQHGFS